MRVLCRADTILPQEALPKLLRAEIKIASLKLLFRVLMAAQRFTSQGVKNRLHVTFVF